MICKLALFGENQAGQTSLLRMSQNQDYDQAHHATVGIDFTIANVKLGSQEMKLVKYDIGSNEGFMSASTYYVKMIHLGVIVYDVTKLDGLASVERWHKFLKDNSKDSLPIIMVANKIDKINERVISQKKGARLAEKLGIQYFETSAKDKQLVDSMFDNALQILIEHKKNMQLNPLRIKENQQLWHKINKVKQYLQVQAISILIQLLFVIITLIYSNLIQTIATYDATKDTIWTTTGVIILALASFGAIIYTVLTLKIQ